MAQEFLNAAEQILKEHGAPMHVKDIVQMALDNNLLESTGVTPINTMRARLSEHLRKLQRESVFVRTKANKFGLREWATKGIISEYITKPFEKNTSKEIVACIRQDLIDKHKRFFGFHKNYIPLLNELSNPNNIIFIPRGEAKKRSDVKQIVSYVLLKYRENKYLSFVRGNYGQKESLLKGVLCLGFGGHVNITDIDLFSINDGGVTNSAFREIAEELKGLKLKSLSPIGVINDDSSPLGLNHIAFVFESQLPQNFKLANITKERSVNRLSLVTNEDIWKRFHELEFWSQLLSKHIIPQPIDYNPVFIKTKNTKFNLSPLIIVGEIGSGKSEVANYLSEKFGIKLISTRKCVASILKEKDFKTKNRNSFQEKALKLTSNPDGIQQIADRIISQYNTLKHACVIIDGIRNLETYNLIKSKIPDINLIYIDAPRDSAYKMFSQRSDGRKVQIEEFRLSRHHEVEKEITLFKTRADAYLFNGGTLKNLYQAINQWWNERSKT